MNEPPRRPWGRMVTAITATLAVAAGALALGRGHQVDRDVDRSRMPEVQQGKQRDVLLAQGWGVPAPPRLIKPTYWPFVFGLGIAFLLGGIATRFLVSGVGLFIFAVGSIGWIVDLLDEQDNG